MRTTLIFWIDLFAGAGGTSSGIHLSGCGEVVACVNHDNLAIESHKANHPKAYHFVEDVRTLNVKKLLAIVMDLRKRYPGCIINLWASLECTHFSKAKGGKSRKEDSRTLAWTLYRYVWYLNPDGVFIENVREFLTWGPLDEEGQPIQGQKGEDYDLWIKMMHDFGYQYEYRILNSADFGAYQSRERYFGQFISPAYTLKWPAATHTKSGKGLPKWRAVRKVLELDNHGKSILSRKKNLAPKTIRRIHEGCIMSEEENSSNFLAGYYSTGSNIYSSNSPCGSVTTKDRFALVRVEYRILNPQWHWPQSNIEKPCPTVIARQDKSPLYLLVYEYGDMAMPVYEDDHQDMVKLKEYMVEKGITDIKMRMLTVAELKRIQGFPEKYVLIGSSTLQKKFIGNAVEVNTAKALARANYESITGQYRTRQSGTLRRYKKQAAQLPMFVNQ